MEAPDVEGILACWKRVHNQPYLVPILAGYIRRWLRLNICSHFINQKLIDIEIYILLPVALLRPNASSRFPCVAP